MMNSPMGCFHRRNLLTYSSLLLAVGAIAAASAGSAAGAGALVALAVVADTFDGRFARLFGADPAERSFGAHLDSLSDAIAFGIAPAVCTAMLVVPARSPWVDLGWWLAAFFYAGCAITRLGFYHLPHASERVFVGLPVPVAALIWTTALLWAPGSLMSIAVFGFLGAAMVAPLPISRPSGLRMAMFVSWVLLTCGAHAAVLIR